MNPFEHIEVSIKDERTLQLRGLYIESNPEPGHWPDANFGLATLDVGEVIPAKLDAHMAEKGYRPATVSEFYSQADGDTLDNLTRAEGGDPDAEREAFETEYQIDVLLDEVGPLVHRHAELRRFENTGSLLETMAARMEDLSAHLPRTVDADFLHWSRSRALAALLAADAVELIRKLDGEPPILGLPAPVEEPVSAVA